MARLIFLASFIFMFFGFVEGGMAPAKAGDVVLNSNTGEFSMHVVSWRERRFKNIVMQQYDYSCGAAALATLLTYDYNTPVPEQDPFIKMIQQGDKAVIQKNGFSMLDMKNYLESLGLHPVGVQISLDDAVKLGIPGIVLIKRNGYLHFVVLRAVDDRRVLMADPALGSQIVSRDEFESMWDGIMLIIRDQPEIARTHFNEGAFWAVRPPAPVGVTTDYNGLSLYSANLFLHNTLLIAF